MRFIQKDIQELKDLTAINNHLLARLFIAEKLENKALIKTVEALMVLIDSPYVNFQLLYKIRFSLEERLYIQITKNIENSDEVIASL